jgi:hypothetical protein
MVVVAVVVVTVLVMVVVVVFSGTLGHSCVIVSAAAITTGRPQSSATKQRTHARRVTVSIFRPRTEQGKGVVGQSISGRSKV